MKATDTFKNAIQKYLQERAKEDDLFAVRFNLPSKNIDECVNFILNTVRESGCNGFDDPEIFGMAVHYYNEDELDPKYLKKIGCNVVVNHHPVLSDEEKAELAEKAKKDYYEECLRKQKEIVNKPKRKEIKDERQLTLF